MLTSSTLIMDCSLPDDKTDSVIKGSVQLSKIGELFQLMDYSRNASVLLLQLLASDASISPHEQRIYFFDLLLLLSGQFSDIVCYGSRREAARQSISDLLGKRVNVVCVGPNDMEQVLCDQSIAPLLWKSTDLDAEARAVILNFWSTPWPAVSSKVHPLLVPRRNAATEISAHAVLGETVSAGDISSGEGTWSLITDAMFCGASAASCTPAMLSANRITHVIQFEDEAARDENQPQLKQAASASASASTALQSLCWTHSSEGGVQWLSCSVPDVTSPWACAAMEHLLDHRLLPFAHEALAGPCPSSPSPLPSSPAASFSSAGGRLLICCPQGVSRCATVMCAVLMSEFALTLREALALVTYRR